ncbi:MAG: putative DNA binding domain-containing protein [Bacteroidales bacterium]|nr:putative DNA binding domain-containing protein [Bacteroidales bacterium]
MLDYLYKMTKEELIQRLDDLEWEDFEVKRAKTDTPKNARETVSAFSNTSGGWIIFGISQNGKEFKITGVDNPEKIEQDFTSSLRGETYNIKITPECVKHKFDEGVVLAFKIPPSNKKPVYFNNPKNTFIRTASGDQRATQEEIDAMYRDQAYGTMTSVTIADSDISDLNKHSIERYRDYLSRFNPSHRYTKFTEKELLEKTQVVIQGRVSYAGLLFFGKEDSIQRRFPDFRIDLLEIPGTSYADAKIRFTFRLEEQENLWEYYFTLFDRLRQRLNLPFQLSTEGFAIENYPQLEAIREALVNMLMHADYFSPGKSRIRIFDDRIEFWNPGSPPKSIEYLIKADITIPRNPIIAKLFRVVKLAENAGFGFDKMIGGWSQYTKNAPEFLKDIDSTTAIFEFPPALIGAITDRPNTDLIRSKLEERMDLKINSTEVEIVLEILKDKNITIKQLSEVVGVSTTAIDNNIGKLKTKGLIERVGADKGGFWKVLVSIEES